MKKFIRQLTIFSLIFIMTFGVGFSSQKGINVQAATTQTTTTNDGKLRKNGVLFTGISDNKYYKRGVFTKYTGWKNWKGNRYYLKKERLLLAGNISATTAAAEQNTNIILRKMAGFPKIFSKHLVPATKRKE